GIALPSFERTNKSPAAALKQSQSVERRDGNRFAIRRQGNRNNVVLARNANGSRRVAARHIPNSDNLSAAGYQRLPIRRKSKRRNELWNLFKRLEGFARCRVPNCYAFIT